MIYHASDLFLRWFRYNSRVIYHLNLGTPCLCSDRENARCPGGKHDPPYTPFTPALYTGVCTAHGRLVRNPYGYQSINVLLLVRTECDERKRISKTKGCWLEFYSATRHKHNVVVSEQNTCVIILSFTRAPTKATRNRQACMPLVSNIGYCHGRRGWQDGTFVLPKTSNIILKFNFFNYYRNISLKF